jgi:large subunit ribosomal protein L21
MYAVIRAGGKQFRVAPGDVIRVEKVAGTDGVVEFPALAVSTTDGQIDKAGDSTRVVGQVMAEGRGAKILVFHYKRKKQYKKLRGHRQDYTAVRITEIAVGGQSFKAPDLPAKKEKKTKKVAEVHEAAPVSKVKHKPASKKTVAKKAAKKSAHKQAPKHTPKKK